MSTADKTKPKGHQLILSWAAFALYLMAAPPLLVAGDGLVALTAAAPSCDDGSGNIYVDCGNGTSPRQPANFQSTSFTSSTCSTALSATVNPR